MKGLRQGKQIVTITLLIIAVIGLSVGFAAFSNTLTIRGTADLNPNESNFRLVFANNTNVNSLDTTSPVAPLNQSTLGGNGRIDNNGSPKIRGLTANFTQPGQSVSYRVYIVNTGKYTAYLTNLVFNSPGGSFNACTPLGNTSSSLVATACSDIYVTVQIGNQTFRSDGVNLEQTISNMSLAPGQNHQVTITITYTDSGNYTDGDFRVTFGDIYIQYRSLDEATQTVEAPPSTPTDPDCFVSVIPGQINAYLCNDTELVIEDGLQLGTRSVESISFNSQKCAAFETMLQQLDSNYTCSNLQTQFNSLKTTSEGIQQIYGTLLGTFAQSTYGDESSTKNSITSIGSAVFAGRNLTSLEIGEGITTLNLSSFLQNSISELELPSTLTTIGDYAFAINNLTTVDLKNVQSIGMSSFSVNSLLYVDIPNSVTGIGTYAFSENSIQSVSLGSGLTSVGYGAFILNNISNIDFSRATSLATISNCAFQNNYLTTITIPNSVTSIGEQAFMYNNLTTVTLGTGISSIGSNAFGYLQSGNYGPNAITHVTINALKSNVSEINQFTFGYDSNANCTNTIQDDWKSNTCITWVNG